MKEFLSEFGFASDVIVNEDNKFLGIESLNFLDDFCYRAAAIGSAEEGGNCTKGTRMRAAPGGGDCVPDEVSSFSEQVTAGDRYVEHAGSLMLLVSLL